MSGRTERHDFQDRDAVLEHAARLIEERDILNDFPRPASRRKRDREDADLQAASIADTRARCAAQIRAQIGNSRFDPVNLLRKIADDLDGPTHMGDAMHLIDAWPLAWRGWLTIECLTTCNSNCIPPPTRYLIRLTDKGRAVLAQAAEAGRRA